MDAMQFVDGPAKVSAVLLLAAGWLLPAPHVAADQIRLNSGIVLEGKILKRNEKMLWLDVGPDVLAFNVNDIDLVELSEPDAPAATESDSLFDTARNLPELSPREQAKRVGPAVIKVATPRG
ncbi:MAG: hypothetical protein V3T48_09680, partial [Vicinamibacterales bacterium]